MLRILSLTIVFIYAITTAKASEFEISTLDNGLRVVVVPSHRAPVVQHTLWYHVGGMDEANGQSGIAHLLEHLMFKGTPTYPKDYFSKTIARYGGQENAFTSRDYTAYYQIIPKQHLLDMMQMESDRMRNLILSDEDVEIERKIVIEERRQRVENSPDKLAIEYANGVFYRNHPYAKPVTGWIPEIMNISKQDILDFYNQYYHPNNALLVLAGDIDMATAIDYAQQTYGKIPAGKLPKRRDISEPKMLTSTDIAYRHENIANRKLHAMRQAPSYHDQDDWDIDPLALAIAIDIIGGDSDSPFYKEFVRDKKHADSAYMYYSFWQRGPASFHVYITPKEENTANGGFLESLQSLWHKKEKNTDFTTLKKELNAFLNSWQNRDITQAQLDKVKQKMIDSEAFANDELTGRARSIGVALINNIAVDDVKNAKQRILDVNLAQIHQALRDWLKYDAQLTLTLEKARP